MVTYNYILIAIALIAGLVVLKIFFKTMRFLFMIVFFIIIAGVVVYCIPPLREYLSGFVNLQ
ncbi:MAG: hypothetical protein MRK01_16875 [Candidatus Scalindua sp.]|nr:hypothetical protein [Candidatus Scalindua sp.]